MCILFFTYLSNVQEITQYLFVHSVKSILHVDKCITQSTSICKM